jgi:hypothetical protein
MPKEPTKPKEPAETTPWERFERLAKKIVNVPKNQTSGKPRQPKKHPQS